jgi:formylglycine-generating enzyme required for sulfatase activity
MDQLHVFLSSPGDVSRERQLAREVLDQLESERPFRNQLKLEVVAWDKAGSDTATPAHIEPQEAINRGLRKPSECDIVIIIFWSRMGTPLSENYRKPLDNSRYRSGTEYELFDGLWAAQKTGKPTVLIYRRLEEVIVGTKDPERDEKLRQWDLVEAFFEEFRNPDGSYRHSYKEYYKPHEFMRVLERDLRSLIENHLGSIPPEKRHFHEKLKVAVWDRTAPPFPGLRPFTPDEAHIFYSRDRQIDQLIRIVSDSNNRFTAVVGVSGSGKSSLVSAGLIPALKKGAIPGSQEWLWIGFTPAEIDDNPFMAIAYAFKPILERFGIRPREMAKEISQDVANIKIYFNMALDSRPQHAELLLFIDQFEEFFTLVETRYNQRFVDLLTLVAESARVRAVVTMRSDFYCRCLDWPLLNVLFAKGQYPLLPPNVGALYEMITRPAQYAGLEFEDGLVNRILDDTGTEPGALALMAFALYELWKMAEHSNGFLTHAAYESFNGVHGAIGKRAEVAFKGIAGEKAVLEAALAYVLRELVELDDRGVPTRRRARKLQIAKRQTVAIIVEELTDARLLVTGQSEEKEPTVEVAHDAIFTHWPRFNTLIKHYGDDLYLRRQVRHAAARWEKDGYDKKYIWSDERVMDVVAMMAHLGLGIEDFTNTERSFLGPTDRDAMISELKDSNISHEKRALIGRRLSLLGDNRPGVGLRLNDLPDLVWCKVPEGEVTFSIEEKVRLSGFWKGHSVEKFQVEPFYIAMYPITWKQFKVFLDDENGFVNPEWWKGLIFRVNMPKRQGNPFGNHPADNISWLEAVAYCKWLTAKLGYEVSLPTEWEWQQAATGGISNYVYPWGANWNSRKTNTFESGLNQSTAVGLYPQGASPVGALDMSGNVWEWCLNEYGKPKRVKMNGEGKRVVRGGSWINYRDSARTTARFLDLPLDRDLVVGFRLRCSSPIP